MTFEEVKDEYKEFYSKNGIDNFLGVLIFLLGVTLFVLKLLFVPANSMNSGLVDKFIIPFFGSLVLSAAFVSIVGGALYWLSMVWAYWYRNGKAL